MKQKITLSLIVLLLATSIVVVSAHNNHDGADFEYWQDFESQSTGDWSGGSIATDSYEDTYSIHFDGDTTYHLNNRGPDPAKNGKVYVRHRFPSEDEFTLALQENADGSGTYIELENSGGEWYYSTSGSGITKFWNGPSPSTWVNTEFVLVDDHTVDVYMWEAGTSYPSNPQINNLDVGGTYNEPYVLVKGDSFGNYRIDEIGIDGIWGVGNYNLNGRVTDAENGTAIDNETIDITQSGSSVATTETNSTGYYSITLAEGNYNVSTVVPGYNNKTKAVALTENKEVNFQLLTKVKEFTFKITNWMDHGTTQPYRAFFYNRSLNRRIEVTNDTLVTSSKTTVVTVDSNNHELKATSDKSINDRSVITAQYSHPSGDVFTIEENVTVANRTLNNIGIMPPSQYHTTALGFGEEQAEFGIGSEIQWIFVAIFLGASVAWKMRNEWMGVGSIIGTILLFWALGTVGIEFAFVAVFFGVFAAYQLQQIPSRSDTNVGNGISGGNNGNQ